MAASVLRLGRYLISPPFASGGMATVHFGRLLGDAGFSRTVAIKRLHPQFVANTEFMNGFIDEARLASRITHPNVVPTLDVVSEGGELFVVMEYVAGESLSALLSAGPPPLPIAAAITCDTLHGLHAAHEAMNEDGAPLEIVHRDVSPQNVLVGVDGIARILDFGVAKARGRLQTTENGAIKGKLRYMAPEQLLAQPLTRSADIYSCGAVLWEVLAGRRLYHGESAAVVAEVLRCDIQMPSTITAGASTELDAILRRALDRNPRRRFPTALDMAQAVERATPIASRTEVARWVEERARPLADRTRELGEFERAKRVPDDDTTATNLQATDGGDTGKPSSAGDESLARRRPSPVRAALLALLALVAVWGVALAGWSLRGRSATAERAHEAVALQALGGPPPVSDAPPAADPPSPVAARGSSAAGVARGPAPHAPAAARRKVSGVPVPVAPRTSSGPSAQLGCDPPTSVDAEGHTHFKRWCFAEPPK